MTPSQPSITCICGKTDCVIPYGLCHCGCEKRTKIATVTRTNHGHVKGEPHRYIFGHRTRWPKKIDGYKTPQMRRQYKLKELGLCIECGAREAGHTVLCEPCRIRDRAKRKGDFPRPGRLKKKYTPPIVCKTCGAPVSHRNRRYCDEHRYAECKYCGKKFECRVHGNKKYCSRKCSGRALSQKRGPEAYAWQGGKTTENQRIRGYLEYENWRRDVYSRDNWTCQDCGVKSKKGNRVEIHAHHIKSFAGYPELRFDINNGVTLCVPCHSKRHGYYIPTMPHYRNGQMNMFGRDN